MIAFSTEVCRAFALADVMSNSAQLTCNQQYHMLQTAIHPPWLYAICYSKKTFRLYRCNGEIRGVLQYQLMM